MPKDPNSQTIDVYDQIAKDWAHKKHAYLLMQNELDRFIDLLPKNPYVLDLGCGSARDANYLQSNGCNVLATDLSNEVLKQAKKLHPELEYQQVDIKNLPFNANMFDGVWANASLLHLEKKDMTNTLKGIKHVLSENGVFYLNLKLGDGEKWVSEDKSSNQARYFAFYQPNELRSYLEDANFTILDMYTFNGKQRKSESRDINWLVVFARK